MLYRFPTLFYRTQPSACAPTGDGVRLSDGDKRGLSLLYPVTSEALNAAVVRREGLIDVIEGPQSDDAEAGLESMTTRDISTFAAHASQQLRESLRELKA